MRAPNVALFLLSFLIFYTISAPVKENTGLTSLLDSPVFVKSILPGGSSSEIHDQARGLVSKEQDIGPDLEKRRGGRGGSRTRIRRPARKRPNKKKKPAQTKKKPRSLLYNN
ncbi:hypothetical protein P171DRAFT_444896 [Karstenula rhodostoma CBS 690.94]|uniref:Uncharacterized protein n=1 Tax=Karstenula rhodostoma CBS 690.94 TaxID=1392251 RepID=A0A9P4UAW3_9PLEO|nr:hypothetical protein P171DRAFT_444896 [Karstenula rhodostoma CBS 690.94]